MNESFYGGLSGIATFFLILYQKNNKEVYLSFYRKLLRLAVLRARESGIQSAFSTWLSRVTRIQDVRYNF